jgi:hypothetical protein
MSGCGVECIRVNGHTFTESRCVRRMFQIEYIRPTGNGRETDKVVIIAKDITEAMSFINVSEFKTKIGNIENVKDLGTVIDMDLVKKFQAEQEKRLVAKSPLGSETRERFQGIDTAPKNKNK